MNPPLYPHMIHDACIRQLREQLEQRAQRLADLQTPAQARQYASEVKRKIRQSFGKLPARTPLNPRVTGRLDRDGYTVDKLIYESRPGYLVTANLYTPTGPVPAKGFPAVLGTCGHSLVGKAADAYQHFARSLALKGYVCLIYDPVSQGERDQYIHLDQPEHPGGPTSQHNMAGNQLSLVDEFFGTWRAWDGIRSLDHLLSLPNIDKTRVGVTGNSGGGTLTTFLNALDDRFTMAAPSCYVTSWLNNLENELPADSEQTPPHILAYGLDMADFFIAQAPRPVILLGQQDDFFDIRGTRQAYQDIRHVYRLLGAEKNVEIFIGPTKHGYSVHNREAMYGFFNKHAGVNQPAAEPVRDPEPVETLHATPAGQVAKVKGNRRIYQFTAEIAQQLKHKRKPLAEAALKRSLRAALRLPRRQGIPHHRILRPAYNLPHPTFKRAWRFGVESQPGIMAILAWWQDQPLEHYAGQLPGDQTAVTLYVGHTDSTEDVVCDQVPQQATGLEFFTVDVRGIGHSRATTCNSREFFEVYGSDFFYASYAIMQGQSLAGLRTHDLLATLDLLKAQGVKDVHLVGRGMGSLTATFAACLHPLVKQITLKNALLSFHELTQTDTYRWPLSALPYGILTRLDLPDCYQALAQRMKVTLIEPWDAKFQPWQPAVLKKHLKSLKIAPKLVQA